MNATTTSAAASPLPPPVTLSVTQPPAENAPGAIRIIADVPYVAGADAPAQQRLDLYLPTHAHDRPGQQGFPTLCFVHGGGLMMGDKRIVRSLGITCARGGVGLVAFNHRLSPDVAHPAHIDDVADAFAWVMNNISTYGGDNTRIAIAGHSSGAYLAALLGAAPARLQSRGVDTAALRAIVPISGFFHVERLAPERPKYVWGSAANVWTEASPATHARAPHPPTLLLYADGDDAARRQESLDYGARLASSGIEVNVQQIDQRDHRSIFTRMTDDADSTVAAMLAFLHQHLR